MTDTAETILSESADIEDNFPLFVQETFDRYLNNAPYKVGIFSTYPEELRRRMSAALVSYLMQLSSVDYTLKRYIPKSLDDDLLERVRIDSLIQNRCERSISSLMEVVVGLPAYFEGDAHLGFQVSDFTVARMEFALGHAFSMANRGALYESVLICRMILEQISWSSKIFNMDDAELIQSTSVTKSIGAISKSDAGVRRFYGWLSNHAHWTYDAHIKSLRFDRGLGITLASSHFKTIAYAAIVVLCEKCIRNILEVRREIIRRWPDCPSDDAINLLDADKSFNEIALFLAENADINYLQSCR